jgi:cyclase
MGTRLRPAVALSFGSRHLRLVPLARGVHAAIATPGGYGLSNAGIVDLGDETLVFDTMLTPTAAEDLVRASVRLTGRKPRWAVNSHRHGDHIWGNPVFRGAHVVSSVGVRDDIRRTGDRQLRTDRRAFRGELARIRGPRSPYAERDRLLLEGWVRGVLSIPASYRVLPPDLTFQDELVLEGSRRSVCLLTYGGGHSPHDVFAYLPDERILFAGDLALRGYHPSVGDGRPRPWISILRRMERLRVDRVLPGHGEVGDRSSLGATREYLAFLERTARDAVRGRRNARELARTPIPSRFDAWGFAFMFPGNLARAYALERARPPRPAR